MNIPKLLEFIDQAVYSKTDKHLTKLQKAILEGTLKDQTYSNIGENNGFTEGHIKDVGYELLRLLSDIFEADINKRNFKSFLEKQNNINIGDYGFNNGNIYVYSDRTSPSPTNEPETPEYQKAKYQVTIETARKLRKKGLSDEEIADMLGLEIEEIKGIDQ